MRVVVIGAGAIGGPVAAAIVKNGFDVTLITKYEELAEMISNQGLIVKDIGDHSRTVIKSVPRIEDLTGKYDIVFMAMKATDVEDAARSIFHT